MSRIIPTALVACCAAIAVNVSAASAPALAKHDRDVARFFQHHPKQAATPAGGRALRRVVPHLLGQIRSLQAAKKERTLQAARAAAAVPAHLALWRCIAGYPGARSDGRSGESGGDPTASNGSHFNILQMTDPWAGIHPIGMSPDAIMAAAESQYAASGYSRSWLEGQWGQTISPCWGYAE